MHFIEMGFEYFFVLLTCECERVGNRCAQPVRVHTHCALELEGGGEAVGGATGRAVRFSKSGGPFS